MLDRIASLLTCACHAVGSLQQQQQQQALLFPGPVEALEVLVANGQPLHVRFFEPLAAVGEATLRLADLSLRGCDVAEVSLQQLMALMQRPPCRIGRLNLSCVPLGCEAVAALTGMLRCNTTLRTLLLSCCALSDPMIASVLATFITSDAGYHNTSVAELDISGNQPGPATEWLLIAVLKARTAPLTVAVTDCAISLKGAARAAWSSPALAAADAEDASSGHSQPAVAIDLRSNDIDSFSVVSISSVLRRSVCSLVSLILDHNAIGDSGCVSLLSAMVSLLSQVVPHTGRRIYSAAACRTRIGACGACP
jgi:hypothetical protein